MKRFLMVCMALFALVLVSVPLVAQETTVALPTSFDLMSLFTSFPGFAAGVILITGIICRYIQLSKNGRSITSWVIALFIGVIGFFADLGIFADVDVIGLLSIVVSFAVGSNVIYNTEWIRQLLAKTKLAPKKSE
jgi:hypothetical protein